MCALPQTVVLGMQAAEERYYDTQDDLALLPVYTSKYHHGSRCDIRQSHWKGGQYLWRCGPNSIELICRACGKRNDGCPFHVWLYVGEWTWEWLITMRQSRWPS